MENNFTSEEKEVIAASFGKRLLAWLVDLVILYVIFVILFFIVYNNIFAFIKELSNDTSDSFNFSIQNEELTRFIKANTTKYYLFLAGSMLISILYYGIFESSSKKATLGKQLMKIVVVDITGEKLTIWRAIFRQTTRILYSSSLIFRFFSFITSIFGHLMMLFNQKSQTLHDKISGALVIENNDGV